MKKNLTWDEYFMGLAIFSSFRSKDPNTKTGAVIVNSKNHIVGIGYNGFVAGVDENNFPWDREGDFLNTKYAYVIHAEANAILNATQSDLSDCRIYISMMTPCNECAKLIAQKEIKEVCYLQDKYPDVDTFIAGKKILKAKGIKLRKIELDSLNSIIDTYSKFYPDFIK